MRDEVARAAAIRALEIAKAAKAQKGESTKSKTLEQDFLPSTAMVAQILVLLLI